MLQTEKRSHRHFLIAPFIAMIAVASFGHGALQGSVSSSVADVSSVKESNLGLQYMLFNTASVQNTDTAFTLVNGSVLVASEGIGEVQITHSVSAQSLYGSFYVAHYNNAVTVAALTAPVLVKQDGKRMIIPVGRQWRSSTSQLTSLDAGIPVWLTSRTTQPIPETFFREQLRHLEGFTLHDATLPAGDKTLSISLPSRLRLSAAKRRIEDAQLASVGEAIENHDVEKLKQILQEAQFSQEHKRMLTVMLSRSVGNAPTSIPLASALSEDTDTWLLMSMHPRFSSLAWTNISLHLSDEQMMIALFGVPSTDLNTDALGPLAVQNWSAFAEEVATSMLNPADLFNPLLVHTEEALMYMEQHLYPERARWYVESVVRIALPYTETLSIHAQRALNALMHWEDVNLHEAQPRAEKEESNTKKTIKQKVETMPKAEANVLSPDEVEARAYALLDSSHAVFTLETTIEAVQPNTARVTGIIFAGPEADREFSFLLHVQKRSISSLQEGTKKYPYVLSLSKFVPWAMR